MRGLLCGYGETRRIPNRRNHRTAGRRGRTITAAQLGRRERRVLAGAAGLTGMAAHYGVGYEPLAGRTRVHPAAPVPPIEQQRRGRRRPDGHRRAHENAANGWSS